MIGKAFTWNLIGFHKNFKVLFKSQEMLYYFDFKYGTLARCGIEEKDLDASLYRTHRLLSSSIFLVKHFHSKWQ